MRIKRKYAILFAIILGIVIGSFFTSNAATFNDINASDVFLKQSQGDTCTLAAATMMVRRAALATGNANWKSITEASMKSTAWTTGGLRFEFSYAGISVDCVKLPGGNSNTAVLIDLLSKHPEGVVIWDAGIPHAVLLTDYTSGIFYCADPARNVATGRIPISSASVTINGVDQYWYVKSPKVSISTDTTKPTITNAKVTNITKNGYTVTCTVSDNVGVTKVSMPTWTINNGQDDLIWHIATINGNTATYTVKRTDHKNEGGTYVTDIYADDAAGNSSTVRVSATLPNQLPTGEFTYAGAEEIFEYAFYFAVEGTAIDVDDESKPVEIEICKVESDGTEKKLVTVKTDPSTHKFSDYQINPGEQGDQLIRAYAIDGQTGERVLLGTKSFYVKKGAMAVGFSPDTVNVRCGESIQVTVNTDPIDIDEPLKVSYNKEIVASEINGHILTIKGLKKGTTTIDVFGIWGNSSGSLKVNVIDSVCSHEYITVVEKEATCNSTGLSYEQCSICGEKKANSEETIPATGKHIKDTTIPPGTGWYHYGNCVYADVNTYICAVCGVTIEEVGEKYTDHKMYVQTVGREATCGEEGYYCEKCAVCGIEKPDSRVAIPATGNHVYTTVTVQEPTCGAVGSAYEECSVCGAKKEGSDKEIPATGEHQFGEWIRIKRPTTSAEGIQIRKCSVCKKTEKAAIAKLTPVQQTPENNQTAVLKTEKTGNSSKTVKVKLNGKKNVTLRKGQKLKIQVKGVSKKEKVSFKSSNKKVATVSSKGIVKTKKTGKITITIKCGKKKAKLTVKIKK